MVWARASDHLLCYSPLSWCSPFFSRFCQFFLFRRFSLKNGGLPLEELEPGCRSPNSKFLYWRFLTSPILHTFKLLLDLIMCQWVVPHLIHITNAEDDIEQKMTAAVNNSLCLVGIGTRWINRWADGFEVEVKLLHVLKWCRAWVFPFSFAIFLLTSVEHILHFCRFNRVPFPLSANLIKLPSASIFISLPISRVSVSGELSISSRCYWTYIWS